MLYYDISYYIYTRPARNVRSAPIAPFRGIPRCVSVEGGFESFGAKSYVLSEFSPSQRESPNVLTRDACADSWIGRRARVKTGLGYHNI